MRAEVAQGAAAPLLREPVGPTTVVHGPSGLGDVEAGEVTLTPDPRPAWQYIVEALKAAPGEITLVTIGPLTNLALALEAAPEITSLVKQVVVMGGAFGVNGHRGNVTPYAEANIHDDPEAADRVFTAPWPVGLPCARSVRHRLCDRSRAVHPAGGPGASHRPWSRHRPYPAEVRRQVPSPR